MMILHLVALSLVAAQDVCLPWTFASALVESKCKIGSRNKEEFRARIHSELQAAFPYSVVPYPLHRWDSDDPDTWQPIFDYLNARRLAYGPRAEESAYYPMNIVFNVFLACAFFTAPLWIGALALNLKWLACAFLTAPLWTGALALTLELLFCFGMVILQ